MIHVEETRYMCRHWKGLSYWKQHFQCLLAGLPEASCVYSSMTLAAAQSCRNFMGLIARPNGSSTQVNWVPRSKEMKILLERKLEEILSGKSERWDQRMLELNESWKHPSFLKSSPVYKTEFPFSFPTGRHFVCLPFDAWDNLTANLCFACHDCQHWCH